MLRFAETCPKCGGDRDARPDLLGQPAADFSSCAFRCHRCGLGFSNAKSPAARAPITAAPELNVPRQARPGLAEALAGAINLHNRPTKAKKFCSGRSEDAVTWTVVAGLCQTSGVGALVGERELGPPEALLLWGHPVDGPRAPEVLEALLEVSDDLGEHPDRRSEPDVIGLWPGLLAFVEAKHGSANDSQPGYAAYRTYLPAPGLFAATDERVKAEGSYQLMRNWVIGAALAERLDVPLRLVNLGPVGIATHAAGFAELLAQTSGRRFEHRTRRQALEEPGRRTGCRPTRRRTTSSAERARQQGPIRRTWRCAGLCSSWPRLRRASSGSSWPTATRSTRRARDRRLRATARRRARRPIASSPLPLSRACATRATRKRVAFGAA